MDYPSKLVQDAVEAFSKLPGVGKKTALRLVLHVLKNDKPFAKEFGEAIINLREKINYCNICHNISDEDICGICGNNNRDREVICVVEDLRDVMAIENTNQFRGVYHVLGGLISPMDGVGPDDLKINSLLKRIKDQQAKEIIYALSTTMEGDTTMFYISRQLKGVTLKISSIARGVSIGGELEYTDEITLARSIAERIPYNR